MAFYQSISHLYDYIFPFSPIQRDFVLQHLETPEDTTLLEIGCATGSLAHRLAQDCAEVTGIDADGQMIIRAREKMKNYKTPAHIMKLDMQKIGSALSPRQFDAVISFGNTLVHLSSLPEMQHVLGSVRTLLRNGGKLMLQIINYDRVLDQQLSQLPTIENDYIRFERHYHYVAGQHKIAFTTILTDKHAGESSKQEVLLYPLRRGELSQLLSEAGFTSCQWFGGFDGSPLTPESAPLVVTAT
ncbi:MAG: class I SAM-dependent methyltransferase [Spirochaetota bacterium]